MIPTTILISLPLFSLLGATPFGQITTLSRDVLLVKIRGGWGGKAYGVSFGGPTEFQHQGEVTEGPLELEPEGLKELPGQDDMYVNMTLLRAVATHGLEASAGDFAKEFAHGGFLLWHANDQGRQNLLAGIPPEKSGHPFCNPLADHIDFQIEADFVGLISPGLPRAAQRMCDRARRLMNYGDGVYGGVFVSAMYAAAFVQDDIRAVVESGLAALPTDSGYARIIRDVLCWHDRYPDNWKATWREIEVKWNKDSCPWGAKGKFNIQARLNGAYIALGLLYGNGDFNQTIEMSTRAGQDSDCNPSSAAGILGVMLGYKGIPAKWTAPLPAIADAKFSYTDYSFNSIVKSTVERAKRVVNQEGGSVDEKGLLIPMQAPMPAKFEQFAPGKVVERIATSDSRWRWQGRWERHADKWRREMRSKVAGAEASVTFEGTGARLVGSLDDDRGTAELLLDGKSMGKIDGYNDDGYRGGEGLWGKFDLAPGPHTVRVVVDGRPYPSSKDIWVYLEDLIVYRR